MSTTLVGFRPSHVERFRHLLRRHGHEVLSVAAPDEPLHTDADLVMVEIDDGRGWVQVCRTIRAVHPDALIAVSGHDTEDVRLQALDAGCDDHLTWDCEPVETMARIDAVLRWALRGEPARTLLAHGPLRLDGRSRQIHRDGRPVRLTRKEFDLLWLLVARAGEVVARTEVLDELWAGGAAVAGRSLDTHVSSLRRKIGKWVCVTVKGYGLRVGDPSEP